MFDAIKFAIQAHDGQYRRGKEKIPYVSHPISVAEEIISDYNFHYGIDPHAAYINAAILHDVVEDTDVTYNDIATKFDTDTYSIVYLLTNDIEKTGSNLEWKLAAIDKIFNETDDEFHLIGAATIKIYDIMDNVQSTEAGLKMLTEKKVVLEYLHNRITAHLGDDIYSQIVINSAYDWTIEFIDSRISEHA